MHQIFTSLSWHLEASSFLQALRWVSWESELSIILQSPNGYNVVLNVPGLMYMIFVQVYSRSYKSAVYKSTHRMGLPDRDPERSALLNGWWWGATTRFGSIWWLFICWAIPFCCCKARMGILILCHDAMDEPVYGSVLGEDNEEGAFHGDEKQWETLISTALLSVVHGYCTVSPVLLAWQHRSMIQFSFCCTFAVSKLKVF